MTKLFILIVMSLPLIHGKLQTSTDELTTRVSLTKCIVFACNRFFGHSNILTVSLASSDGDIWPPPSTALDGVLLAELFSQNSFALLIKSASASPLKRLSIHRADSYIIQIRSLEEIREDLQHLQLYESWNPYAKFLVITATVFAKDDAEAAADIVKMLWLFKITNAVVLLPKRANTTIYNVYSWFPYKEGKCGAEFSGVKIIDECTLGVTALNTDWYPNKIPKDLSECEVKVRTVVFPPFVNPPTRRVTGVANQFEFKNGIEIRLMNALAEAANFKINYTLSRVAQNWGMIYDNGSSTGLFESLMREEVDIGICALGATVGRHKYLAPSESYIQEAMTFCVPHADLKPEWLKMVEVIRWEILILCLICAVLVTLVSAGLSAFEERESANYKNVTRCFLNVLCMITASAVKIQPKTLSVRPLIMLWIIFCLHLNIAYQTSLISILADCSYEKEITTPEEILKANYEIYIISNARRFFENDSSDIVTAFKRKWQDCDDIRVCLRNVALKRNAAMLTPRLYIQYVMDRYVTKSGQLLVNCFQDSMVTYPVELMMRNGFALKDRINELITRIIASGLIPMWTKMAFVEKALKNKDVFQHPERKLTINHLKVIFILYAFCAIFAICVFVLELLINKYCSRRKSIK